MNITFRSRLESAYGSGATFDVIIPGCRKPLEVEQFIEDNSGKTLYAFCLKLMEAGVVNDVIVEPASAIEWLAES